VNIEKLIPLSVELCAFPMHDNQVFLVENVKINMKLEACFRSKAKRAKVKIHKKNQSKNLHV
jgi:hypothetical protein